MRTKILHFSFRAMCCATAIMLIFTGCSDPIDGFMAASEISASSEKSTVQVAHPLTSLASADYWKDSGTLPAVLSREALAGVAVPDQRMGQSVPSLMEFDASASEDGLQAIALGGIASCDFYAYLCYDPAQKAFQGMIVDYGDTQQLYYFPEVSYPSANPPEFYASSDGELVYMVYSAVSGSSVGAENLCIFQLHEGNISLIQEEFTTMADELANCISVSYEDASHRITVTADATVPYEASFDTQNTAGEQAQPEFYYCGSQLNYEFRDDAMYVTSMLEFLDTAGCPFPFHSGSPVLTAKIDANAEGSGTLSGIRFSTLTFKGMA